MTFDEIAVHSAERGFAVGGTGCGKSTLAEQQIEWFGSRYRDSRILIADTKPRFRADRQLDGLSARRRYRRWGHGSPVADSVLWEPKDRGFGLEMAWELGHRIVIAQGDEVRDVVLMQDCIDKFFEQAKKGRPSLLVVDELLDFYGLNGQPVRATRRDGIRRAVRAGREVDLAVFLCSQRPVGIPPQLAAELTRCYLFRLPRHRDLTVLWDNGALPPDIRPPDRDHVFWFYNARTDEARFCELALPKSA